MLILTEGGVKIRVWIDNREERRVIRLGKKEFPDAKVTQLPVGDVVIEKDGKYICIEHKEGNDYNASIKDNRLTLQPINMAQKFDYNFVFIEGGYTDIIQQSDYNNMTEEMYNGKIASLALKYCVPPITVDNTNHFWRMVKAFSKRLEEAGEPLTKPILLPNKHDNLETRMLMCLEGLGEERATGILKKFNFWQLPELETEELITVPGIGVKFAEKIKTQIERIG